MTVAIAQLRPELDAVSTTLDKLADAASEAMNPVSSSTWRSGRLCMKSTSWRVDITRY